MKILLIHNSYQQSGGEDNVVASERTLLSSYGHEVRLLANSNEVVRGILKKISTALSAHYSNDARRRVRRLIDEFKPDIVHVHNFFPLFSPSIYDACQDAGVPVVQTLHNYRLICPGALLLRGGHVCEECIGASAFRATLYGCYRNSRVGTFWVARMIEFHRNHGTWKSKVNRFIVFTRFAKNKFVAAGLPAEKIIIKPNFAMDVPPPHTTIVPRRGALFVGRLSGEKGVSTLIRAWHSLHYPLRILGGGPLVSEITSARLSNVIYEGYRSPDEVHLAMQQACFLVVPSESYEGFPMVLVESFANGLPVIVSSLGSLAEIVEEGVTGIHFESGNAEDLATKVRWAFENPEAMKRMGENARRIYEEKYTADHNYHQLINIYSQIVKP